MCAEITLQVVKSPDHYVYVEHCFYVDGSSVDSDFARIIDGDQFYVLRATSCRPMLWPSSSQRRLAMRVWFRTMMNYGPVIAVGILWASGALADDPPQVALDGTYPSVTVTTGGAVTKEVIYTGLIGPTGRFPARQHVNFNDDGEHKSCLDVTGDLFLTSELVVTNGVPGTWTPYPLYRDIYYQPWFSGGGWTMESQVGPNCCFYHECPANSPYLPGYNPSTGYCNSDCPILTPRALFESGSGLNNSGDLRLIDAHGGSSSDVLVILSRIDYYDGGVATRRIVVLRYARPGRWQEYNGYNVYNRSPGDLFNTVVEVNGQLTFPITEAVQHVSSDIGNASPGAVDASDLSLLAAHLGEDCVDYGFQPHFCDHLNNWFVDMNVDGKIDSSDLSCWAVDNQYAKYCGFAKAEPSNETDQILAWFGIVKTGKTIVQGGIAMPELAVVNSAQMQIAIANPYGYMDAVTAGAVKQSWGSVKTLYR